jgi:hypothetical protein
MTQREKSYKNNKRGEEHKSAISRNVIENDRQFFA